MADSTATLLALALIGVYVFDSVQFLCIGEAVVTSRRLGLHGVDFGAALELAGRRPCVPNPFTPFWPAFRLDWDLSGAAVRDAGDVGNELRERLHSLRAIGALSGLCGLLIAIVAPVALILRHEPMFLVAAAGCFAGAVLASIVLWIKRETLGLTVAQACSLTFVAVICLPCSANLARAVATQRRWAVAASDLPRLGFAERDTASIRTRIHMALSSARRFVPEDGPHLAVIDTQLQKLGSQST
jgi:hypothetical protein